MNSEDLKLLLAKGKGALNEANSKAILAEYGVPILEEAIASNPEEALTKAKQIGFPVVLKALGESLTHKTERGLVAVGLTDEATLESAALRMQREAKEALEGFIVAPLISAKREFVAGAFRDSSFGAVVMFGLGGIFTEALGDVVFRLAPLTNEEALSMIEEIKSKKLLGAFRGEAAVDKEALAGCLLGLSKAIVENDAIKEIDINPILITEKGAPLAVDALIALGEVPEHNRRTQIDPRRFEEIFYPKGIVFVGASGGLTKWGHILPVNLLHGGYEGDVFFVNPKGGELFGRPVYQSLKDLPSAPELAIVTIPAKFVLELLPQMEEAGIRNMVLITSGFAETGEAGRQMEKRLVEEARKRDILILGPNTMGITNPHDKLHCTAMSLRPTPGGVALVAQSGNMGTQLMAFAKQEGIGIRAFSGSGNEAMITIEDYMKAFEFDEKTETVVLYLESVKDGRRFFNSARKVGRQKPVIVLKGGRTNEGKKAAESHTGALAADSRIFDAACKQAGVVQVAHPMDMLDMSAAFSALPLPKGRKVVIMTLGGGWGVITADLCGDAKLNLAPLSEELVAKFDAMLPDYWSRGNPIDLVGEKDPNLFLTVLEELMKWDGCDAIINLGIIGRKIFFGASLDAVLEQDKNYPKEMLDGLLQGLVEFEENYIKRSIALMEQYEKPVVFARLLSDPEEHMIQAYENKKYKGLFFQTPERAVRVLSGLSDYKCWRDKQKR